jgi:hypothetical protein
MKHVLLLCLVVLHIEFSYSQTISIKTDEFTGESVSETSMVILQRTMNTVIAVTGFKKNEEKSVRLSVTYPMSSPVVIGEGEEVLFKLSNGEVIKLLNSKMEVLSSTVRLFLPFSDSQLDEFSKYSIQMVRVKTSDGYIDFKDFASKKQSDVMMLFGLLK